MEWIKRDCVRKFLRTPDDEKKYNLPRNEWRFWEQNFFPDVGDERHHWLVSKDKYFEQVEMLTGFWGMSFPFPFNSLKEEERKSLESEVEDISVLAQTTKTAYIMYFRITRGLGPSPAIFEAKLRLTPSGGFDGIGLTLTIGDSRKLEGEMDFEWLPSDVSVEQQVLDMFWFADSFLRPSQAAERAFRGL